MTVADFVAIGMIALIVWATYIVGRTCGKEQQKRLWEDHMEKGNRYVYAVQNLEYWCGHTSPHAKLIARHLRAEGEGLAKNAGTPVGDEACQISGLREQLRRLDNKILQS